MAGGCYQHCANCGEKSFYDANIDWESQYTGKDEWGNPERGREYDPEAGEWLPVVAR